MGGIIINYKHEFKKLLEDGFKFYLIENPMMSILIGNDIKYLENQYREVYKYEINDFEMTEVHEEYVKALFENNKELINAQGMLREGKSFEEITVNTVIDDSMYNFILIDTKD